MATDLVPGTPQVPHLAAAVSWDEAQRVVGPYPSQLMRVD